MLPLRRTLSKVPEDAIPRRFQKYAEAAILLSPQRPIVFASDRHLRRRQFENVPQRTRSYCVSIVFLLSIRRLLRPESLQLRPCHAGSHQIAHSPTTTLGKRAPTHYRRL